MKTVLLKLSGELLKPQQQGQNILDNGFVHSVIQQIKQLSATHRINIVIGGGNFFRGSKEGKQLGLTPTTADSVGMLATVMNGLILQDLCKQAGLNCLLLSAYHVSGVAAHIDQQRIDDALTHNTIIIFAGGTGNPYFSTDTAAIVRALQTNATTVWKASNVDHVYDADPKQNVHARPLKKISYMDVLTKKLNVMDLPAVALAQEHAITIRVFSIFEPDALLHVAKNPDFGSTIQ